MKGETSMGNQGTDQLPSLNLVLPDDIQQKILENVVASSGTDLFKCKTLCRSFRELGQLDSMYKLMNIDQIILLRFYEARKRKKRDTVLQRCRDLKNPNIMFRDGMINFFHKGEEAGKEMIKEASTLGNRAAKFVVGMLLMGEGMKRKQEALDLLNGEFQSSGRIWDVRMTSYMVDDILTSGKIRCVFPLDVGVYQSCTRHRTTSLRDLEMSFTYSRGWLSGCDVCLWDACYSRFVSSVINNLFYL